MVFNLLIFFLFFIAPAFLLVWLSSIWLSGSCLQLLVFAVPKKLIPQICGYELLYLIIPVAIIMLGTLLVLSLWNDFNVLVEIRALIKQFKKRQ